LWGSSKLKVGIVIPARLQSGRLPNKVLRSFLGKTMIEHVWKRANLSQEKVEIVIAADCLEIKSVCEAFGANVVLTSDTHQNGLSRTGEVAKSLNWDFYIILQADEILIDPKNLDKLIRTIKEHNSAPFYNLITNLNKPSELSDRNIVKCLIRHDNTLISMFRLSGSIASAATQMSFTKKVCGLFAISHECLKNLGNNPAQIIEASESIEQMKLIELNYPIYGVEIEDNYPSVNTELEANEALEILNQDPFQISILNQMS
jgi:3-deoxy-manno-octulosonate cytidylyltransferase (CMP-KDO synthetase)